MITQENVKDKVLGFRAKNRMTQIKFAENCGITRQSIIKIESADKHILKPMTLWKINHYLNIFEKD